MFKIILSRKNYKICFIIYVFINTLALGYLGIDINPLSYLMLIWGGILISYDLITRQINFQDINFLLISVYGLLLFLATLLNPYSNQKSFLIALMQIIIFFLIYKNRQNFSINTLKQELKIIIPLTTTLTAIASLISILMYITNFSNQQNGWPIGMVDDRLFGVYFNCNPAAFLATIAIIMAMIALKNKSKYSSFYLSNIIIQVIYILLTKCRSALIIIAIILAAMCYAYFIKEKNYSRLVRCSLSVLICLGIFLGSIFTTNTLSNLFNQDTSESRFQIDEVIKSVELLLTGNIEPSLKLINQVSSGRIELLHTSYTVFKTSPIIGVGANNFQKIGIQETDDQVVKQIQVVHSHNVIVESFVTTGIIGGLLFLIFIIYSLKDILKCLKHHNFNVYMMSLLFTLIVASEFIGSLFDYGVFYVYCLSATLAWMFLGYLHYLANQKDKS